MDYIGYGISIELYVEAQKDALLFKRVLYMVSVLGQHVRIPKVMILVALVIGHHDNGDGEFVFSMRLFSRLSGEWLSEDAVFRGAKA